MPPAGFDPAIPQASGRSPRGHWDPRGINTEVDIMYNKDILYSVSNRLPIFGTLRYSYCTKSV